MKFFIDENLPFSLKKILSSYGHYVVDVRDIGKIGAEDEEIMKIACEKNLIFITANYKHFANIIMFPPAKYPGIIVVKMPKCSMKKIIERVVKVVNSLNESEIIHSTIIIEPDRIRRRK